jgi:MFS family permease
MSIFSRAGLPVFAAFFIWNVGTGSIVLARPLFAAELGANVFLATLVISVNNFANLVGGPITGFLTDRWGRRPLLITGAFLRGASGFLQFVAPGYMEFLVLEFVGGLGVSMFMTGSTILLADMSVEENRGRALAARLTAQRLGQVMGPAVGAVIAAAFSLRAVFLVNGVSKFLVLFILLWLIAETHPNKGSGEVRPRARFDRAEFARLFQTRGFALISLVAFSLSMMGQGVFSTQFLLPCARQAASRRRTSASC